MWVKTFPIHEPILIIHEPHKRSIVVVKNWRVYSSFGVYKNSNIINNMIYKISITKYTKLKSLHLNLFL